MFFNFLSILFALFLFNFILFNSFFIIGKYGDNNFKKQYIRINNIRKNK